jgi:diguanylate cyclase (GGDEF)-like protein
MHAVVPLAAAFLLTVAPTQSDPCAELFAEAERIGALRDSDAEAGIAVARAALERAAETRCVVAHAEMFAALGDNLGMAGDPAEAVSAYRAAEELLRPGGPSAELAAVLRREGITHAGTGDLTTAVERTLAALRMAEEVGDRGGAAMSAGNLGSLYSRLSDFHRAREFLELAQAGYLETGNRVSAAGTGINLASLLMRQADRLVADGDAYGARTLREQARTHSLSALEEFEAIDHPRGLAMAASNAGVAAGLLGDHGEALRLQARSLAVAERIGNRDGVVSSRIQLAMSYTALGRHAEAEASLRAADELVEELAPALQLGVAEQWVALEEARGRTTEVIARMRQAARIREAVTAADHQARVAEIQARHASAERDRQIEILRHEQEVSLLKLARQRAWLIGGGVAMALLSLLLVVMLKWQRVSRRHADAMKLAAHTDELTGLANRREVRNRIEYEIRRASRNGQPFSLAVLDLDEFKTINDVHGHAFGDRVLVAVADRIRGLLRAQDTLARWGGDELLVLLPETDRAGAKALANKLAERMAARPVTVDGQDVDITISIGIDQYDVGLTVDDCVRAADQAMYRAKRAGIIGTVSTAG